VFLLEISRTSTIEALFLIAITSLLDWMELIRHANGQDWRGDLRFGGLTDDFAVVLTSLWLELR
jgi:hypothetical protein